MTNVSIQLHSPPLSTNISSQPTPLECCSRTLENCHNSREVLVMTTLKSGSPSMTHWLRLVVLLLLLRSAAKHHHRLHHRHHHHRLHRLRQWKSQLISSIPTKAVDMAQKRRGRRREIMIYGKVCMDTPGVKDIPISPCD